MNTALGGNEEQRATSVLAGLTRLLPGGLVLRSVGRQCPGEAFPRWNLVLGPYRPDFNGAVAAMRVREPRTGPLIDQGRDLHQRFALPF